MPQPSELQIKYTALTHERAALGESPTWDKRAGCLWWVDIDGARLLRTRPGAGATEAWSTPETPGFVVQTDLGAPAVGMESGVFLFDPASGAFERLLALPGDGTRCNDAAVDATGKLWAGTMALDNGAPVGVLYAIGADRKPMAVLDGLWTVNGLAVDADRERLYVSDSHPTRQEIWCADLDLASGALGERRPFADLRDRRGRPDGAALDAEGRYWIAGVGGGPARNGKGSEKGGGEGGGECGVLHVFDPQGAAIAELPTPFENPTKPCFGGEIDSLLFVTSKGGEAPNGAVAVGRGSPRALPGRPHALWRLTT